MLGLWSLVLVPCWISFPTPIHMRHFDLGCGNHTTSRNEDLHQSLHFTHSCISVAKFNHLTSIAPFTFYAFWVLLNCPKHMIFVSQERSSQGTKGVKGLVSLIGCRKPLSSAMEAPRKLQSFRNGGSPERFSFRSAHFLLRRRQSFLIGRQMPSASATADRK